MTTIWRRPAAAYHSGWGTVDELLENSEYTDNGTTLTEFPYKQMSRYVDKVTSAYSRYCERYMTADHLQLPVHTEPVQRKLQWQSIKKGMEKMDKETLKSLLYKNESVADLAPEAMAEADAFCEGYKKFLDNGKTEREVCTYSETLLKEAGYRPFVPGMELKAGDKVYFINRKKCVLAATIGKKSLAEGFHLNIAHIDSPRLDLRPQPLYEEADLAFLRTHYYGGIRKYQWPTIPLALHGVIYRADGSCVDVCIGEKDDDPVFCITDLLPHLAAKQGEKKLGEAITGENLNVLIASLPRGGQGSGTARQAECAADAQPGLRHHREGLHQCGN